MQGTTFFQYQLFTVWSFIFLSVFIASSCKTAKPPTRPMEEYNHRTVEIPDSYINIPYRFEIKKIEELLNKQLGDVLYEDKRYDDGDNLTVTATKSANIVLVPQDMAFGYTVPVALDIGYKTPLGVVNATGDIVLEFNTAYDIDGSWQLQTITKLENHTWKRKPRLSLGGFSLSAEFLTNIILNQAKTTIAQAIDEQVQKQVDLHKMVLGTWNRLSEPTLASEEYKAWVVVAPKSITMTRPLVNREEMQGLFLIHAKPQIFVGDKPTLANAHQLPPFAFDKRAPEGVDLHLGTSVTFAEAEKIAKSYLVGEKFESGKHAVSVRDIKLFGQGEELVIETRLAGSYNGNIYLKGRPTYNNRRNRIDIDDLEFTLDTKNYLHKSAAWLLKSTLRKQIKENVNVLLEYNLAEMKKEMQKQLAHYQLADGVAMAGDVTEMKIEDVWLTKEGFSVIIEILGNVEVGTE